MGGIEVAEPAVLTRLGEAAAVEQALACAYQYASWSVDTTAAPDEVGAGAPARARRRELADLGDRHFARIVQVADLQRAFGGAAAITRPADRDLVAGLTEAVLARSGFETGPPAEDLAARLSDTCDRLLRLYTELAMDLGAYEAGLPGGDGPQAASGFCGLRTDIIAIADPGCARAALAELQQIPEPVGGPVGPVPLRPVVVSPVGRPDGSRRSTLLLDPRTRAVAELFGSAYGLLLASATGLLSTPADADEDRQDLEDAVSRLWDCVLRPLGLALTQLPVGGGSDRTAGPTFCDGTEPPAVEQSLAALIGEWTWELAVAATSLRIADARPPELVEAAAALQELAVRFAPGDGSTGCDDSPDARRGELAAMQCGLAEEVRIEPDGPYLATNVTALQDWLGQPVPALPLLALCRCGQSARKPLCDGTHARIDFTGDKSPDRQPDRRDTYHGQATVLDNRGTCAHSGFCTDRLSTVFHAGSEPFVTPTGDRMDEVIRAVRACPSGALSYTLSDVVDQRDVDQERPPAIEVSKDGPYRITGGIPLREADGAPVARNDGASEEHYSLCRCGQSQNKPFCSGVHWYVDFHDPVQDPDRETSLFEWAGGLPALTRMTRIFYEKHVPGDPVIGPLFARMSPDHPERVAAWLAEVFGGPKCYSGPYGGYKKMLSQHLGKCISEEQRARWVTLLGRSADEAGMPRDAEFRSAFMAYIEWGSRLAVENSQKESKPPPEMPMPTWDWGTAGSPTGRVSALPQPDEPVDEPMVLPGAGEAVSFERHVRTFFRHRDRRSMRFAFDLWAYEDVRTHAEAILARVRDGSMPCDMDWPAELVEAFARWVESGTAP